MSTEEKSTDNIETTPSKSQRKRDMQALKDLAQRLCELSSEQLEDVADTDIRDSILAAKKIKKGNARKRQLQYTAKLMAKTDVEPIQAVIDSLDASSAAYTQRFHQLEVWRESLISGDDRVMEEIFDTYPHIDRQQFRQLLRQARQEARAGENRVHFRRLFQYLKSVTGDQPSMD